MTTVINRNIRSSSFNWLALVVSVLITEGIGLTASLFTVPQIATWYEGLNKPSFNPPNWLFGPVWTTLYLLIAIAAYLVWIRRSSRWYTPARNVYIVQLALNFLWSMVFFGMHQIAGALVVIALLWASIIGCIYYFSKVSRIAAWLLVPYLLWVSFASVLNMYIYLLNR